MEKGQIGVILIIIAIMVSVGGGFLLNAENQTTCNTDFTYLTDVTGAFSGTGSDIELDHNPRENITGYSVFSPISDVISTNTIFGASFTTTGANGYWVQQNSGNTSSATLTFTNNKDPNASGTGTATGTWGGVDHTFTIPRDYGVYNTEARTQINVIGEWHNRAVGVKISDIMSAYSNNWTTDNVVLSTNNIYPTFVSNPSIVVSTQWDENYQVYYARAEITYGTQSNSVTVNPLTGLVQIGDSKVNWNNVMLIWGDATVTTATVTMLIGSTSETKYIDPIYGIIPSAVHTSTQQVVTVIEESNSVSGSISIPYYMYGPSIAIGEVRVVQNNQTYTLFSYEVENIPGQWYVKINGVWQMMWSSPQDATLTWQWTKSNYSIVSISWTGGYSTNVNVNLGNATLSSASMIMSSGTSPNISSTITDNRTGQYSTVTGGNTNTLNLRIATSSIETITMDYTTTYWTNTRSDSMYAGNTKLSMLIKAPDTTLTNTYRYYLMKTDSTYGMIPITVTYTLSVGWTVNGINIGNWPAIIINNIISDGKYSSYAQPVSRFVDFQNYTTIDRNDLVMVNNGSYTVIKYIEFPNTETLNFTHEIVSTTVLLSGGGLYIQNGVFSPSTAFPNDKIIMFSVMSSPHVGNSMTITTAPTSGTSRTLTLGVNEKGDSFVYQSKSYLFSDVQIIFIDDSVESIAIGNQIYQGGLYYKGNYYDKGHLYIVFKNNPPMDLGESTNAWTITMDGTWAMSTAYYTGENTGAEKIEWSSPGVWQWNAQEFMIVFMAVMILGTIISAYRWELSWIDWAISIGSCVLVWILMGGM